ncbi:MAG TPA: lipid-A-disaccharide synthase [Xanthobacteraceae bacterium]|nr:lipid-A-disaccharide synthase [Xanthobacteraceae bacterium]
MAESAVGSADRPLTIFIIAAEESGDRLGGALMQALRQRCDGKVQFAGVGGPDMAAAGAPSLFPVEPLSIMGFAAIPRRLPLIMRRIREAASAAIAAHPDVLVIIDSSGFTHRVARRVRKAAPGIPIVDYVCPQVWAWRSGRARVMRSFIDHVLALLPFEPEALERLGGPPCTYVGHPLAERIDELRANEAEARRRNACPPLLLVLPGSRRGEVRRLLAPFAATLELVSRRIGSCELVLPTLPHLVDEIRQKTAAWSVQPRIICDAAGKLAAFRQARAALAASGTVTLELALAAVPTVAAYRVAPWEAAIARRVVKVPSAILANLVLGENTVPEFLQENCVPGALADALVPLLADSPQRQRQLNGFARLDALMQIGSGSPSGRAADIVLRAAGRTL